MSSKSIQAYNTHTGNTAKTMPSLTLPCWGRNAPTQPPPAPSRYCRDIRARAAELRAAAGRILAQAAELEESAERIERGGR